MSLIGCASSRPERASSTAARHFLADYVTADGRVIRHDQGGDIVSEGQAYGLLIAELAGEPSVVRTIWSWTEAHLAGPDGLLASHATGSGQIEDPHSASDADALTAYALLRYSGPGETGLRRAGRRIASAVLANESVSLPGGAPLIVAGPWARTTPSPTVDPSYLMPGVFAALARLTGDSRWRGAAAVAVALIGQLTDEGRRLPPDWAQLTGARLTPIPQPGGPAGVQYSFDAARLPLWFATSCDAGARSVAAGWWRNVLSVNDRSLPLALSLDGKTINGDGSPLTLLAGAAAATAAGDTSAARSLRTRASEFAQRYPTYYGAAWAALGPALLDGALEGCAGAVGG